MGVHAPQVGARQLAWFEATAPTGEPRYEPIQIPSVGSALLIGCPIRREFMNHDDRASCRLSLGFGHGGGGEGQQSVSELKNIAVVHRCAEERRKEPLDSLNALRTRIAVKPQARVFQCLVNCPTEGFVGLGFDDDSHGTIPIRAD